MDIQITETQLKTLSDENKKLLLSVLTGKEKAELPVNEFQDLFVVENRKIKWCHDV